MWAKIYNTSTHAVIENLSKEHMTEKSEIIGNIWSEITTMIAGTTMIDNAFPLLLLLSIGQISL
jgi:hypothetical protein